MRTRFTRRLVFAVLWLIVFDQFVPRLLARVEHGRYEGDRVFRFENSDLFALAPLVSYLREHPRSDRRRIVFLGNSIIYGWGLASGEAIPARFERQQPDTRVFNAAFNAAQMESSYVIAKSIVESVDGMFVLVGSLGKVNGLLPSLIPIDETDLQDFALRRPDPVESRLESFAGLWRLYAFRYRLQAALLATSARQFVYLHKGDIVRRLAPSLSSPPPPPALSPPSDDRVVLRAPRSASPPDSEIRRLLRQQHELVCRFADLARSHRKRTVFLQVEGRQFGLSDSEVADFNAVYAPFAEVVILGIPTSLRFDAQHLTPSGAQAVAKELSAHETGRPTERR